MSVRAISIGRHSRKAPSSNQSLPKIRSGTHHSRRFTKYQREHADIEGSLLELNTRLSVVVYRVN